MEGNSEATQKWLERVEACSSDDKELAAHRKAYRHKKGRKEHAEAWRSLANSKPEKSAKSASFKT